MRASCVAPMLQCTRALKQNQNKHAPTCRELQRCDAVNLLPCDVSLQLLQQQLPFSISARCSLLVQIVQIVQILLQWPPETICRLAPLPARLAWIGRKERQLLSILANSCCLSKSRPCCWEMEDQSDHCRL